MNRELSAGEFAALTGLSPKALRLYRERGILPPAFVAPDNGYRYYDRAQVQQGQIIGLLRRAAVPMAELRADFDYDGWRERLALSRLTEDFYLDVAQEVAGFEPAQLTARSGPAPEVAWVGVRWQFTVPGDLEEAMMTFVGMSVRLPGISQALHESLAGRDLTLGEVSWTAAAETPGTSSAQVAEMVLTRPVVRLPDEHELEEIGEDVRARCGEDVVAVRGRLPRREEVTFGPAGDQELTPVQEAALDYQQLLAFDCYVQEQGAQPIGRGPRQVVTEVDGLPLTVFDVLVQELPQDGL